MGRFMYAFGEPTQNAETRLAAEDPRIVKVISTDSGTVEEVAELQTGNHVFGAEGADHFTRSFLGGVGLATGGYWVLVGHNNNLISELHGADGSFVEAQVIKDTDFGSTMDTGVLYSNYFFPWKDGVVYVVQAVKGGNDGSLVLYHKPGTAVQALAFISTDGGGEPPVFYNPKFDLCTAVRAVDGNGGCELVHFGDSSAIELDESVVFQGEVASSLGVPEDALVVPFGLTELGVSPTFVAPGISGKPDQNTGGGWTHRGYLEGGEVKGVGPSTSGNPVAFIVAGDDSGEVVAQKEFTDGSADGIAQHVVSHVKWSDGGQVISYDLDTDTENLAYNYTDGTVAYNSTCVSDGGGGVLFLTPFGEKSDGWDTRDILAGGERLVRWDDGTYASGKRIPEADGFTFPDGSDPDGFYVYFDGNFIGGTPGGAALMGFGAITYPGGDYSNRAYARAYENGEVFYLNDVFSEPPYRSGQVFALRSFGPPPEPDPFWTARVGTLEIIEGS